MKCEQCGFENPTWVATADLDHLRAYLSPPLIEELQFNRESPSSSLLEQCVADLIRLLETTCTHLPAYLVERVMCNPIPGQAGGQFVNGTLLFADISGFTAMSERLSRIGREGAEEITAIVNGYFDAMLSILREHAGQLIKFGGDALLGLFIEAEDTTRAVQTALRMQEAMTRFAQIKTSQGVFPLQMKVAIHKGRFFSVQLGTSQGMENTLVGADVNATAATESAATAGQVLLDRTAYEAINVPCRASPAPGSDQYWVVEHIVPLKGYIEPLRQVATTVPSPATPRLSSFQVEPTLDGLRRVVKLLDALTPYLPSGLLARIAGGAHAVSREGENRLVAALFTNVFGLGDIADRLGPGHEEQIVAALNHYFVAMENSIQRFGGVINKMDLYDHGDKLLALFGAPLAHEDDAERAVRAALAMQEALAQVGCSLPDLAGLPDLCISQKIGIGYGYVFAGYVGTVWRREYTVMGDAVNVAARLMAAAEPGSIFVGDPIRRKVQALFDLTPRGEARLKGKSEPVPVFRVEGIRAIPESLRGLKGMTSPLVGRQTEWNQLMAALDRLAPGQGQLVFVTGEAGLGKSRLVAEMRQHATGGARPAVQWIEGRCLSYTESISYWPFQAVVRQMTGLRPDDSGTEALDKLRNRLDEIKAPRTVGDKEASITLPYLANFLNLPLDDALQAKVRYLDAEALQKQTFVAISTLIEAHTQSAPLVLALDDIQWIDQASQSLLEYLMALVNRVPLMLILLFRPEREKGCGRVREKAARELARHVTEIALRPLTPAEEQELFTNLVQVAGWPAEMQERILSRAEGNPLYVEEVLRALIDARVLVQDESGQWRIGGDPSAIQVPDTLEGVIMARLDRLDEPSRGTAQVSSVIGRIFPFDILAHTAAELEPQLNQCLVGLQQHEIIRETQRAPELVYTFKHGMTQEVCYHSLLNRIRRLYHRKIAEYLCEATGECEPAQAGAGRSETENVYPVIAHHAFLGQDWPRALRYQILAGQQAQKLFANHEAIDHFEKAMQSAENLPADETLEPRQIIHAALGELLTTTGQYEHATEHLQGALALAVERGDLDAQARACRWLARLHELRGEYPPALDWIQRGLDVLGNRETAEAAQIRLIAGLIHSRQGHHDQAFDQCQRALQMAQTLGALRVLARVGLLLGHLTHLRGNSAAAIVHFQRALDLYQQAGDIQAQATAHNLIGNAYLVTGQWSAAEQNYRRAGEIFERIGDVYNLALADNNLGEVLLKRGDLEGAVQFYQEALRLLQQIGGSLYVIGFLHNNLGAAFIRRGDAQTARQHLSTSQDYLEQAHVRDFLPELHRHLAEAALLAHELSEAEAQGQQALSLARELSMQGEEGSSLRVLGEIATAQGRLDEAERYLGDSLTTLAQVGDEYEGARSRLSLARVYAAQGKTKEMLEALDLCTPVFERLEAAIELAATRALREQT